MASRADLWLQPRPGTDLALALGMLKVIVDEVLYEKTFVENWTKGFTELVDHLHAYPLDRVLRDHLGPKRTRLSKHLASSLRQNPPAFSGEMHWNIISTASSARGLS